MPVVYVSVVWTRCCSLTDLTTRIKLSNPATVAIQCYLSSSLLSVICLHCRLWCWHKAFTTADITIKEKNDPQTMSCPPLGGNKEWRQHASPFDYCTVCFQLWKTNSRKSGCGCLWEASMSYLGRFPLTFCVYAVDFFRREAVYVGKFIKVSINPLLF